MSVFDAHSQEYQESRTQVCGAAYAGASKTDTEEKKCI